MPTQRHHKPDPYKDFDDDDQRRRALNWREACHLIKYVTLAITFLYAAQSPPALTAFLKMAAVWAR